MNSETLQILKVIGYISIIIATISNFAFFLKAASKSLSESSFTVILITYIVLYVVGLACIHDKAIFMIITVVLFVLGGLSLVTLLIMAFSENLDGMGFGALVLISIINFIGGFILLLGIIPSM